MVEVLESVFRERGAPEEILTDNDTAFKSKVFLEFVRQWNVRMRFRCAYVPSGNGIVERCHRTVKVIAARKQCSISEAVYLYNVTPRNDSDMATAPANVLYNYEVRVRGVDKTMPDDEEENDAYMTGDLVWVKRPGGRCTTRYAKGRVTRVVSRLAVEVDGVPRHVRDVRPRSTPCVTDESGNAPPVCSDQPVTDESDEDDDVCWLSRPQPDPGGPDDADEGGGPRALRRSSRLAAKAHVCYDEIATDDEGSDEVGVEDVGDDDGDGGGGSVGESEGGGLILEDHGGVCAYVRHGCCAYVPRSAGGPQPSLGHRTRARCAGEDINFPSRPMRAVWRERERERRTH